MSDALFERELLSEVNRLTPEQQRRVLSFARALSQVGEVRGESGASLIATIGMFGADDLDEMQRAIDEGCEGIDWGGWE